MGIIAVAGGSGDLGCAIVKAILSTGRHKVFSLSRKSRSPRCGAEIVSINYDSVASIGKLLESLQVDTVISTINLHWEGASKSQLNLIRGAAASSIVKRFIPSEFNIDYRAPFESIPYQPRLEFLRAEEELKLHSGLTYTLIRNGFFMDYFGLPYKSTDLLCHLYCLVDLAHRRMVIPGNGDQTIVVTHTSDVAKLVAALLDVKAERWPREASIVGERLTLTELVRLVQENTGHPFQIEFDSIESLRKNNTTELPSNRECYINFPGGKDDLNSVICTQMIGMASGVFDIQGVDLQMLAGPVPMTRLGDFLKECVQKSREDA